MEKVLLTREMLIMLNPNGDPWENPEMDLTLLTLLTFPQREAKSASGRGNANNVNNVNPCCGKMILMREMLIILIMLIPNGDFLGKSGNGFNIINISRMGSIFCFPHGEMLIMLIMLNPLPDFPKSPQFWFNIINIINISRARTIFSRIWT